MPYHNPTEFPEPTYQEATEGWQRCQAENARLQERVKEEVATHWNVMRLNGRMQLELATADRDRGQYKAQSERRRKALEGLLDYVTEMAARVHWQPKEMLPDKRIGAARAAIDLKPEERR